MKLHVCSVLALSVTLLKTAVCMEVSPIVEVHSEQISQENREPLWQRYNAALAKIEAQYYQDLIFEGNRCCTIGPAYKPTIAWDIDDTLILSTDAESFLTGVPVEQLDPSEDEIFDNAATWKKQKLVESDNILHLLHTLTITKNSL